MVKAINANTGTNSKVIKAFFMTSIFWYNGMELWTIKFSEKSRGQEKNEKSENIRGWADVFNLLNLKLFNLSLFLFVLLPFCRQCLNGMNTHVQFVANQ